jgi:hypothetical protein
MPDNLTSVAPQALGWALGELGCGPSRAPPRLAEKFNPQRLGLFRTQARFGPFTVDEVIQDDAKTTAVLSNAKRRTFHLVLKLEAGALSDLGFGALPPPGFRLRYADEGDTHKIAQVERDAPIEVADRVFSVYRPRLRDFHRLQERTFRALIEREGEPVAARVFAQRSVKLRGAAEMTLRTSQTARALPSARGHNLMSCFALWASDNPRPDAVLAYFDPGNMAVDGVFRTESRHWSRGALELTFPCAPLAGPSYGRPARPGDAVRLAALSNAAHGRAALYGVMDADGFEQRLHRAPDAYSWRDVLLGDQAMLGVWASLDETTDSSPGRPSRRRTLSVALDYGFEADGQQELLLLLRAQASRMQAAGATHVTLYTYAGAPACQVLEPLAEDRAEIGIQTSLSEPADADGVHTDPLYL